MFTGRDDDQAIQYVAGTGLCGRRNHNYYLDGRLSNLKESHLQR